MIQSAGAGAGAGAGVGVGSQRGETVKNSSVIRQDWALEEGHRLGSFRHPLTGSPPWCHCAGVASHVHVAALSGTLGAFFSTRCEAGRDARCRSVLKLRSVGERFRYVFFFFYLRSKLDSLPAKRLMP